MAVTEQSYTGNGSTTNYSFTFPYLKSTDIEVQVDATVTTAWSLANATTVQFNTAPSNGAKIKILRQTNVDNLTATFYAGSAIKSEDLNDNYTQNLYKTQEIGNRYFATTGGTMTGDLSFGEDVKLTFEGATDNAHETILTVADPTADRTITLPDTTGTVVTTGDSGTVTSTMIADATIATADIANSAVTTAKINNDAITADKIADDVVNSEHFAAGSIDTEHIADSQVTTAKIAGDAVTGAKIADDSINSEHYVDGSIDTAHIADSQVTTAKIADDAVTTAKIADDAVVAASIANGAINNAQLADNILSSTKYIDGSIETAKIADAQITTAKIANTAVTNAKLGADCITQDKVADDAIRTEHLADQAVTTALIADAAVNNSKLGADCISEDKIADDAVREEHLADNAVTTARIAADAINGSKIADDSINSEHYVDGSIDTAHIADSQVTTAKIAADAVTDAKIADNAVTTDHIADAELTTLAGMQSGTASILAGGTALTATLAEINTVVDGKGVQTTISDSDAHYPTSGAVVDYVAAQIAPIGGLEVIANEDAFPTTQPASGVVISIADAAGVVVNGSGVSTTARTSGNGSDNVTINNFPSSLYSETLASGNGLMVTSTGSSHTYNYHKLLASESDVKQLSDDINDFNSRYRINAGEPGSNNDDGDLVWDTSADKMKVYDATASAWKEVTSSGDFKFLVAVDAGTTTAATFDGSDTSFDLKEATNSGSAASVTNINQLMVVLNGVVQKPNAGSWSGSGEGFYLTDSDTIRFATAPPTGSTCFIVQSGSAVSIPTPGDNTVATAKIQNSAVTTDKLASDAVTGAKIADDAVGAEHIEQLDADLSFADSVKAKFGAGNDLNIYHDGTNSYLDNVTGAVRIRTNNNEDSVYCYANAQVELYHDNEKKIETKTNGAIVQDLTASGAYLDIKGSDGVNGKVYGVSGTTIGLLDAQNHYVIKGVKDGAVSLYYDNDERIKTEQNGTQIFRGGEVFNWITRTDTGADNNWLGCFIFKGNNDASEGTEFAKILAASTDVSDGTEDGKLLLQTMKAGTMTDSLHLESGYTRTPNNPLVMLSLTANQSVANTTTHNIDWAVGVNRGSNFDASNERFTAPIAGDYLCTIDIQFTQNVDQLHTGIQKNGGSPATHYDAWVNHGDDTRGDCRAVVVELAANDYITFHTYQGDGDARNLEAYRTHASIKMVG